jgi:hypothetical protein
LATRSGSVIVSISTILSSATVKAITEKGRPPTMTPRRLSRLGTPAIPPHPDALGPRRPLRHGSQWNAPGGSGPNRNGPRRQDEGRR